jgi:hypothetical protein
MADQKQRAENPADESTDELPELSERGGVERSAQPGRTTESGEVADERHDRTRDRALNRRQGGAQDVQEQA